jgi:hypothetical protein
VISHYFTLEGLATVLAVTSFDVTLHLTIIVIIMGEIWTIFKSPVAQINTLAVVITGTLISADSL